MLGVLIFCLIAFSLFAYFKAYGMSKRGELTVFVDWTDFAWSAGWIFSLLMSIYAWCAAHSHSGGVFEWFLTLLFIPLTATCLFKLISGAYKYNSTVSAARWSLVARIVGSFFTFAIIGRILRSDDNVKKGANIFSELLVVGICVFIFKILLLEVVRDNRDDECVNGNGVYPLVCKRVKTIFWTGFVAIMVYAWNSAQPKTNSGWQDSTEISFDKDAAAQTAIRFIKAIYGGDIDEAEALSEGPVKEQIKQVKSLVKEYRLETDFSNYVEEKSGIIVDHPKWNVYRVSGRPGWFTDLNVEFTADISYKGGVTVRTGILLTKTFWDWHVTGLQNGLLSSFLKDYIVKVESEEIIDLSNKKKSEFKSSWGKVWDSTLGRVIGIGLIIILVIGKLLGGDDSGGEEKSETQE